jgi:purine-binding chemotaxis protein CheW
MRFLDSPRRRSFSAPAVPEESMVQLCAFFVGNEEYAIDIKRVQEILQPQRVTPIPQAPSFVEGMINLRGSIIPVVDLRKRLGSPSPPSRGPLKPKLLICLLGRRRVGLLVDGVSEIIRVIRGTIKPAPLPSGARPYIVGVCGPADRLKLLVDLKALLASDSERQCPEEEPT